MAFVIGKAEKVSVFSPKKQIMQIPGPGQYDSLTGNFNKNQYCAPFNTSQVKVSSFDVIKTNYGPGSYQPKYFKDLNKVKSNEGYVFASRVERFQAKQQKSPKSKIIKNNDKQIGNFNKSQILQVSLSNTKSQFNNVTTKYSFSSSSKYNAKEAYSQKLEKNKQLMQQIREHNRQKRIQSIKGKRQFIRVILTSTNNTENIQSRYIYRNIKGKTLGPGSYQNVHFKPKSKSVTKWNLDRNDRFKTENSLAPGPGAYNINSQEQQNLTQYLKGANTQLMSRKKKQKPSPSFASTVIRSHMDTIIYRTNIPIKAAILQDRRLKDTKPGPGTYNSNLSYKDKKSFNYGMQNNFGSSSRVVDHSQIQRPGPGYYNLNLRKKNKNQCNQIIKNVRAQIFGKKGKMADNYNKNNSLSRSYSQKVGGAIDPSFSNINSYREQKQKRIAKFCSLEERCFSKLGTMCQQERFKQQAIKVEHLPGPGQYHNQRLVSSLSCNEHDYKINSVFKSETDRNLFENNDNSDVPFYNIIRNDIGFRAEKARKYIQNLRKINIDKTPFQTGEKRFKQPELQFDNSSVLSPSKHEIALQKQIQKRTKQQSSNFKSGTKRQIFKSEPKPGPGDYNAKVKNNGAYQNIEKKSFNKNYGLNKMRFEQQKINHSGGFSVLSRKNSNPHRRKNNKTQIQKNEPIDPNESKSLDKISVVENTKNAISKQ